MRDRHLFGKVNWFGYHLQILDADTIFELVDKQVSIFTGDKHTITSSSNRNDLIPWHGHNLDHVKYLDGHTSKAILWMKSGKWSENWNSKGSWKDGKWWKAMQEEWKLENWDSDVWDVYAGWAGKRWKGMELVEEWNRIETCRVMIVTGRWFEYCNKYTNS